MKGNYKKETMTEQQSREEQAYLNGRREERRNIINTIRQHKITLPPEVDGMISGKNEIPNSREVISVALLELMFDY